jgi:hypothetical protein
MNEFTLQIFADLLRCDEAWDKSTRELRYKWVLEQAYIYRYALYEEVMLRLLARAVHWCRVLTSLPEESYQTILQNGVEVEYFADECLSDRFVGDGHPSARVVYIESIWYGTYSWSPDMDFQIPSKEELLALNIKPHFVPDKENQPSLF